MGGVAALPALNGLPVRGTVSRMAGAMHSTHCFGGILQSEIARLARIEDPVLEPPLPTFGFDMGGDHGGQISIEPVFQ